MLHIAEGHALGILSKRVKICKVGNSSVHGSRPYRSVPTSWLTVKTLCQAVLVVHLHVAYRVPRRPPECEPFLSSISTPGSRIVLSPRNLLMIETFHHLSLIFLGEKHPPSRTSWAKTPPRSISPTRSTGAFAIFAIPMLTRSSFLRLISAGLPAPSMTMISFSAASWSKCLHECPESVFS